MIISEDLRLQKFSVMIDSQSRERHTSSNLCFITVFCFASMPRRTRFAALFRSAFRTKDSPFPVFVFSASSNTRPSNAFLRWAPVRFSSSGFATPDNSRVWISLCRSASFCRFDLDLFQIRGRQREWSGCTSPNHRSHYFLVLLMNLRTLVVVWRSSTTGGDGN